MHARARWWWMVAGAALLLPGCMGHGPLRQAQRPIRLVIQPIRSSDVAQETYKLFIAYLERETGRRIEYVSADRYDRQPVRVATSRADISLQSPLTYIGMAKTMNARLLAVAVPGTHAPQMRGAVIVRSGSPIRQLSDLRGKIVATISRRATAGCLAPLKLCREQGLEADRDFRLVTMADEDRILWAVVRGRIDAGFVHEQSLNTMPAGMLREQLRVVAYTQEVPTWCVAAFPRTDPEVAARVTAALLQLDGNNPEHQAILDPMRLSGFTAGNDADYAPARKLADELGVPY